MISKAYTQVFEEKYIYFLSQFENMENKSQLARIFEDKWFALFPDISLNSHPASLSHKQLNLECGNTKKRETLGYKLFKETQLFFNCLK